MASIHQIAAKGINLTVNYAVNAVGIFCRKIKPVELNGLKLTQNVIGDSISLATTPIQNKIKNLCANFLENTYGGKPYPEEIEVLFKNISRKANDDVELLMKRCKTLFGSKSDLSFMIYESNFNNSDFLIDNMEKINSILTRKICRKIGPNIGMLYSALGEKEINLLSSCGGDTTKIVKLAKQIIYDSRPHNISFGKTMKTVDSSDVIAIVSGNQSLSYFETGSSKNFEKTVLELAEIAKPKKGQQYYYQIVEGILQQRPDLVKIVDELNTTIETSSLPIKETLANFFKNKALSGELPKTITLKTIIPDENALIWPKDTYNLFKARVQ